MVALNHLKHLNQPDLVIPGCTNQFAENFNPDATIDDGSCYGPGLNRGEGDAAVVENQYANRLGFYSMLENTILKEVVAKEREYSDEGEEELVDTGLRKRIYLRWDLLCQILNQKVVKC